MDFLGDGGDGDIGDTRSIAGGVIKDDCCTEGLPEIGNLKVLGDGVDLLGEGVDLLGEGVDLLGDGVDLLGDGGDPRSIAVGSSKTTVAQKGDQRLEIRKCDLVTDGRTDLHG